MKEYSKYEYVKDNIFIKTFSKFPFRITTIITIIINIKNSRSILNNK